MIEQDHLQRYELTLNTRGILHIGSGKALPKKEYIFDKNEKTVAFLNEQAFFNLLIEQGLVEQFEEYCMRKDDNLYAFLYQQCGLSDKQVSPAILYKVDASDALDAEHSIKNINCFMRDGQQRAYVPGSCIKGAIRTVLLFDMLQKEGKKHSEFPCRRRNEEYIPEEEYFHTLGLNQRKPDDAVNSIMRGIQISDSQPINNRFMILTSKSDIFINGNVNKVSALCRECVAPGAAIRFQMTLDQSILKGKITVQTILNAINAFAKYYQDVYEKCFTMPCYSSPLVHQNLLFVGGGDGFFTKSLAYPYLGEERGLIWTSNFLKRKFSKRDNEDYHDHEHDVELGISPRMLKYGRYREKLYPYGACEVTIR